MALRARVIFEEKLLEFGSQAAVSEVLVI